MLRVIMLIKVEQQTPPEYHGKREQTFEIEFAHSYEIVSDWQNLTDTAKIQLPKNVVIRLENKRTYTLRDTNKPLGAPLAEIPPVFMNGDKITIDHGYWYYKDGAEQRRLFTDAGGQHLFEGYITRVRSEEDMFELECEDNMWKLKQVPAIKKAWLGATIEEMISEMIKGTDFKLPAAGSGATAAKVATSLSIDAGALITDGMSVAKVLEKLRTSYYLPSYFRGRQLRVGVPVYYEEEARTHKFCFSGKDGNIIEHDLEYKIKEDMVLSAVATTVDESEGATNHRGKKKVKTEKKEILITLKKGKFVVKDIPPGETIPHNEEGERRSFPFTARTTREQMIAITQAKLEQSCYTGFYGHFTAFGMPFVRHGDTVDLTDPKQPERNGRYKVKAVTYTGGVDGLRQQIHLDYKLP